MAVTPLPLKPVVWTDTETSGLDPQTHDILSIAITRPKDDGGEIVYTRKLKLARPENASPKALAINGYTPEGWADADNPRDVFQEIADLKLFDDCIIAGQNVRFDVGFLEASFKRYGIRYNIGYHLYDTVTLALLVLKPYVQSVSLVPTCVALGIPVANAHDALVDLRLAQRVDQEVRNLLQSGDCWGEHFGEVVQTRISQWEEAGRPGTWFP